VTALHHSPFTIHNSPHRWIFQTHTQRERPKKVIAETSSFALITRCPILCCACVCRREGWNLGGERRSLASPPTHFASHYWFPKAAKGSFTGRGLEEQVKVHHRRVRVLRTDFDLIAYIDLLDYGGRTRGRVTPQVVCRSSHFFQIPLLRHPDPRLEETWVGRLAIRTRQVSILPFS